MIILVKNLKEKKEIKLFPPAMVARVWRYHALYTSEYPKFFQLLGVNFIEINPAFFNLWDKS
jgi:hypothetical protein